MTLENASLKSLQVKVLTTLEEIQAMRNVWTAMQWHPNADLDFYTLIVSVRSEVLKPYVLVVSRGDEPVAVLAGRVEEGRLEIKMGYKVLWQPRVRRITLLYGGCMGQTGEDVNRAVVKRLLQSLREQKADLLSWGGIRWKSPLQQMLSRAPAFLCRDYLARPSEHWTMDLPTSLDEFLERKMNKKHRYWAKRAMRVLEKDFPGAVRYRCVTTPEDVETLFSHTVQVARKTYQWGLGVGFQDNEENRKRLRLAAQKGWLRGYLLYLKEEPVAFWICTVYGDTVHLDFTGFDPELRKYEIGTALFLRMLGELGAQNVRHLDFGLGTAFYKERFGDGKFEETTMCVFGSSARALGLSVLRLLTGGPSELARALLLRFRLEQKVKRIWRGLVTPAQEKKEPSAAKL